MTASKGVLALRVILFSIAIMTGRCNMGAKESMVSEKYPAKPITYG